MSKKIIEDSVNSTSANTAFKFRIYPNKKQIEIIDANFKLSRDLYNYFLAKQKNIDLEIQINYFKDKFNTENIEFKFEKDEDKYKKFFQNNIPIEFNDALKNELKNYVKNYKTENKLWFNRFDAYKEFVQVVKDNPEKYDYIIKTNSTIYNSSIKALDNAFKNMKKIHSGFPKFKSYKDSHQSYSAQIQYDISKKHKSFKLEYNSKHLLYSKNEKFKKCRCYITLPSSMNKEYKLKNLEIIIQQEEFFLNWNNYDNLIIKSFTVSKNTLDQYYISFSCHSKNINDNITSKPIEFESSIGIDRNIGHYDTTDKDLNNSILLNKGKIVEKYQPKLNDLNKKISNKIGSKKNENKSNSYIKSRKEINKIHNKISNIRNNNNHLISKKLVESDNDTFIFEDLDIKNMIKRTINQKERKNQNVKKKRSMRRNILDTAWNDLINKTTYKAKNLGKNVVKIDPRNTSKRCDNCGFINKELKLSDRTWTCPKCGKVHQRDLTSANNIKEKYFNIW